MRSGNFFYVVQMQSRYLEPYIRLNSPGVYSSLLVCGPQVEQIPCFFSRGLRMSVASESLKRLVKKVSKRLLSFFPSWLKEV